MSNSIVDELADDPVAVPPSGFARSLAGRVNVKGYLRSYTLLLVLALVWMVFQVKTDGIFLTQRNLVLLALQSSIVSLAAISAVMLIVTRNFDLSVGSAVAFVGAILAMLTVREGINPWVACGLSLLAGMAMGAWNGMWVTRLGVSSFIVTLAGLLYFRGLSMILTDGTTVAPLPKALTRWASGFVSPRTSQAIVLAALAIFLLAQFLQTRRSKSLGVIEDQWGTFLRSALPGLLAAIAGFWVSGYQGIPNLVALVLVCALGAHLVMSRTRFGMQLYAIGGNPEAAALAGIDVRNVIFSNFVIAGLFYGIAGIALTARVSGSVPGSAGLFLELDAIAAAIIGGTALAGGRGTIFGALLGAILMGSLNNGLSLMNVETFYQDTVRGVVLLLAVFVDQIGRRLE
jgi:D-xylose transport system permease protein